ncbi:MAG: hypothetical protein IPL61_32770 [Myxococcales bacterium]|nr:hypothetical protein [Myxococcales bacterium]
MPRSHGVRPRAARRRLALVAVLLWVVGIELGPDLHLALHRHLAAHVHEGDGPTTATIVHVHYDAPHRHGPNGEDVWDSTEGSEPVPMGPVAARAVAGRAAHGRHSLAHRGLALAPPPPPVAIPIVTWHERPATPPWCAQIVTFASVPVAGARGPPA